MSSPIDNCLIIDLPKIYDMRGSLSFIENGNQIPFSIQRVYYLYDIPGGESRGGHAHRRLQQLIIPVSGSFDIHLNDGMNKKTIHLNRANTGLYICPLIWREIDNFTSGSVCLVLASAVYDENDYFRDYDKFLTSIRSPASECTLS